MFSLSIPVAEPNKAQMRFKSQNTIITVSVSEHSVSLTRVCVSKYKILDTRRFRELLGRRPGPAWLASWAPGPSCHKLPQLPPRPQRKQRVTRRGMRPRDYEHGPVHTIRQKRKQKPESLRCWEPRGGGRRWELVTVCIWGEMMRVSATVQVIPALPWWQCCGVGVITRPRAPPIRVVIIPTSTTCCHNPDKFCSPI